MNPDVAIEVRFKTPDEGGRTKSIKAQTYSCPMLIDEEGYDCRLLLKGDEILLGERYVIDVKFMNADLVLPKLFVDKAISLWEGKIIATGRILRIYS
ncbi:hypothetical protein FCE95_09440 [Luteimonas gilva]|uniref:Translation elongation factor EFTu/EF1A C-terminal domain-containing protein n=1 Tax=Luteimonas gilva TaxID=2572684 RepID=A0A4U5JPM5_9GAMM|nr:hypothetical protein [Luteimonas gilva]TKR30348.1 hypothetical protein FCE95_09440 [Luteimonas gilva]